jgi:hypothetical protein
VSKLPEDLGGRMVAIRVAEYARAGRTPEWLPDAKRRIVPADTHTNRHGVSAKTEFVAHIPYVDAKGRQKMFESRACPILIIDDGPKVAWARQAYTEWWFAVSHIRRTLKACGMLRQVSLSDEMPPMAPWDDLQQRR